jgi:hypothetical protein
MIIFRGKISLKFVFYIVVFCLLGGIAILGRGGRVPAGDRTAMVIA